MARTPLGKTLPDFPWDSLAGAKKKAQAHPGGIVDLSVGNPVDPCLLYTSPSPRD